MTSAVAQSLCTALVYYFFYKFLLAAVGMEQLGIWSLVLAISSTANVANFGIGSSVVRLVARNVKSDSDASINGPVHTALLLVAALFAIAGGAIYLAAPFWLAWVVDDRHLSLAMELVPYSILSLWLNALSNGVFLSCLDGLQKNYYRSALTTITTIFLFGASVIAVPRYGLVGVAYAQVAQAVILLVLSVVALKRASRAFVLFPVSYHKDSAGQIFSYGVREQVIALCQLGFDPVTKSLMAGFGGLGFVAYYELANRLVMQARALVVSANQVTIPIFAQASHQGQAMLEFYRKSLVFNYYLGVMWVAFVVYGSFIVSRLFFDTVNPALIYCTSILAVASFFNLLCNPSYFANMGSGHLRGNVVGNIIIATLNPVLGFLLGTVLSGYGAVLGWGLALSLGSCFIILDYHKRNDISLMSVVTQRTLLNVAITLSFLAGVAVVYSRYTVSTTSMAVLGLFLLSVFVLGPFLAVPEIRAVLAEIRALRHRRDFV